MEIHFEPRLKWAGGAEHALSRGMPKCYEDLRGSKTPLVCSRDQNWPVGASINVSTVSCIY